MHKHAKSAPESCVHQSKDKVLKIVKTDIMYYDYYLYYLSYLSSLYNGYPLIIRITVVMVMALAAIT
ncbi:MAG: hypothetical protein LBE37_10250, partial [Sphingobacterium sp.]|nr:hypothetical protein [Sphingobacterium sp.]